MRSLFAALASGAMWFSVACGSGSPPGSPSALPAATSAVQSLKVTGPPLVVGDTLQFTAAWRLGPARVRFARIPNP